MEILEGYSSSADEGGASIYPHFILMTCLENIENPWKTLRQGNKKWRVFSQSLLPKVKDQPWKARKKCCAFDLRAIDILYSIFDILFDILIQCCSVGMIGLVLSL